jgi:hypothetical protein
MDLHWVERQGRKERGGGDQHCIESNPIGWNKIVHSLVCRMVIFYENLADTLVELISIKIFHW